jgi:hypothetical protein
MKFDAKKFNCLIEKEKKRYAKAVLKILKQFDEFDPCSEDLVERFAALNAMDDVGFHTAMGLSFAYSRQASASKSGQS